MIWVSFMANLGYRQAMSIQVALLRGVNVGGHAVLPMAELRSILKGLGAKDVHTYIQSGNAVFRGALEETRICDAIEAEKGFRPRVMLMPFENFEAVVDSNPLAQASENPKTLHLFFLASPSLVDESVLIAAKGEEEQFVLTERALYLHTPKLLSGSKLAERLEQLLGVPATGRNLRTAQKIRELGHSI